MSTQKAQRISKETGYHVEYAPANREYVIWPEGIPVRSARRARELISEMEKRAVAWIDPEEYDV